MAQFPRVFGYVVVTAVILALGLGLSALIGERRSRVVPDAGRQTARVMVRRATLAGTVVMAALIVRSRRRLATELAEAGKLLEAERSRYADEAVRYERVHLAREIHDSVAHWLTAVVIQARAGQVRSLTQQESVAAMFADIVTAAGRADEEIARAATLLGRDGTSPPALLKLADHLVDTVRATGADVTFRRSGHHVPSPAVAADACASSRKGSPMP